MSKLTFDQIREARKMREAGMTGRAIGQHFGVSRCTIFRAIDPKWRERRNSMVAAARVRAATPEERRKTIHVNTVAKEAAASKRTADVKAYRVPLEDLQARFAEIPKHDTRDLTGRLMGDPLPARSALGMMRAQ